MPKDTYRPPRPVVALGAVSLLNDTSSEMVYPLLPLLLRSLGAPPACIGLMEGLAEMVASLLKLFSGWLADWSGRHRQLAFAGYALAAATRPLLALAGMPLHVLVLRCVDRIGKGVRSAPRDALIAAATPPAQRGLAFGWHRTMDNLGAAIGPVLATLILLFAPENYRLVFALASIPALAALAVFAWGAPRVQLPRVELARAPLAGVGGLAHGRFGRYLLCVSLFTLGNSSDVFLLMRAQDVGAPAALIPLLWMGLNLLRSACGIFGGWLADRYGRVQALRLGWLCYALVYAGFGFAATVWQVVLLLGLYGMFYALTESAERALVADFAPLDQRGQAYGLFHCAMGIAALPASGLFGWLWQQYGVEAAFLTGSGLALAAVLGLSALLASPHTPRRL